MTAIQPAIRPAISPAIRSAFDGGFAPSLTAVVRALFAAGKQGVWFDLSDMSTLFQDSAGTIPVTAVEQPVGLILDKSGRGNHARQTTAINRPIYRKDGAGRGYLAFNGTNSSMSTAAINFTATDKMSVFAGVRKLSDVSTAVIAELSNASGSANFLLTTRVTGGYDFYSRGTASSAAIVTAGYPAPITNNLTGLGDISGDKSVLRINGTQAAISSADQGTGNYGNYPLYIGARGGTTLFFNGNLYGLIVRGAATPDLQVPPVERYINSKTGAY